MADKTLRECREALGLSQPAFAAELRVGLETYRVWDSGRRLVSERILAQARALVASRDDQELLPLAVLATQISVHVRTLRQAARDGRLAVSYDTRTTYRSLRTRATPAAAKAFRRTYYGKTVRPNDRRTPLTWSAIPADYDVQIRAVRQRGGASQAHFAKLVGAARKAVVYQWESRKRCPSPMFWQRIEQLGAGLDCAERNRDVRTCLEAAARQAGEASECDSPVKTLPG